MENRVCLFFGERRLYGRERVMVEKEVLVVGVLFLRRYDGAR